MNEAIKKFDTERLRRHRSNLLSETHERTIGRVESVGCEVIQVTSTETSPGWSYTVGIYDTCG